MTAETYFLRLSKAESGILSYALASYLPAEVSARADAQNLSIWVANNQAAEGVDFTKGNLHIARKALTELQRRRLAQGRPATASLYNELLNRLSRIAA